MKIGHASTIMSLITDLKLAMCVREPRKWNSDSFSNYAYLLAVLLSLKLLLLVIMDKMIPSFTRLSKSLQTARIHSIPRESINVAANAIIDTNECESNYV